MNKTLEALRRAADDYEKQANQAVDRATKAALLDRTTELHWLANEVAELCPSHEPLELV